MCGLNNPKQNTVLASVVWYCGQRPAGGCLYKTYRKTVYKRHYTGRRTTVVLRSAGAKAPPSLLPACFLRLRCFVFPYFHRLSSPFRVPVNHCVLRPFYQQLDGLRALSVFAVILAHGLPFAFFRHTFALGFWGVNLFFVLSGFLITEILLKEIHAGEKPLRIIKSFFVKRTLRIFPVFYFVLLLAISFNLDGCRAYWGYAVTYTLNFYNAATGAEGRYLSHIWSLCVEEQFYLFWPFLLLLVKPRFHKHLIFSVVAGALLFRWTMTVLQYHNFDIYNYRFMFSSLDALGIGAALAYLKLFHLPLLQKLLRYKAVPLLFLLLFFLLKLFRFPHQTLAAETLLRFCASVCCFFVIAYGIFEYGGPFGRFLHRPVVRYVGRISYGLYLFHLLIQCFFDDYVGRYLLLHYTGALPKAVQYNLHLLMLPVVILLTVLAAAASFRWLEKPFLRLKTLLAYAEAR